MKKCFLLIVVLLKMNLVYCQNSRGAKIDSLNQSIAQFNVKVLKFKKVKVNSVAVDSFLVKNIGGIPLVINNVKSSCGCTVADYTKQPILPNKEGMIKVKFKAGNKPSRFLKTLVVSTNTYSKSYLLKICGEIIE